MRTVPGSCIWFIIVVAIYHLPVARVTPMSVTVAALYPKRAHVARFDPPTIEARNVLRRFLNFNQEARRNY